MVQLTKVNDSLAVAGQITASEIAELAKAGYGTIINNRPDGEEPGQMDHETAAAQAKKHGLEYHYIPVVTGSITRRDVIAHQRAILRGSRPVVAHCRSGTRSYLLWMAGRALLDGESSLKLVAEAALKGYDLRVLPSLVEKLQAEE